MNKTEPTSPELQEALFDLRRFLSDEVSPLAVSDAITLLIRNDPEIMVSGVRSWVEGQLLRQQSISTATCLYHALKKIHVVGELNLVSKERLAKYVHYLSHFAIRYCAPPDRKSLASNLINLGETETGLEAPVNFFYLQPQRDAAAESVTATPPDRDYSREAVKWGRRFDLLLERLENNTVNNSFANSQRDFESNGEDNSLSSAEALLLERKPDDGGSNGALTARAFAMAAGSSQTEAELDQYLQRLGHDSLQTSSQDILTTLGHNLPDWAVLAKSELDKEDSAVSPLKRSDSILDAMQRMVSLAADPNERAKRFNEIVQTAVLQFNNGALGRAVSMLDAAEALIAAKEVDASTVKFVRQRGHEKVNYEQLRTYVEAPQQRPLVRKVLNFFEDLSPAGLLAKLRVEEVRNQRRLIMTLLEIHGTDARPIVFTTLQSTLEEPDEKIWYFQRNLLHLLHLIPRRIDFCSDDELNTILTFTKLRHPTQVIREALPNLALKMDERAEKGLINCLREYESGLLNIDETPFPPADLRLLLDRVVLVLARVGTPAARRAILEHGLKQQPLFGDTLARLSELGNQDLSRDQDLVKTILSALARELPNRILNMFVKRDDKAAVNLIESLAGTPSPEVRRTLEEIARKYSNQEFAIVASDVLAGFDNVERPTTATDAPIAETSPASLPSSAIHTSFDTEAAPDAAPATASLAGDLALFGLPSLMQNLADSRLSGVLTLKDKASEIIGTVSLDEGKIRASTARRLRNIDAVYQLLQKPLAGTFQFVQADNLQTSEDSSDGEPLELIPVLLEGMRRYDELQASCAVVPDDVTFQPTGTKPTAHEEEQDENLVKAVWDSVSAGATAADCEEQIIIDSYRIRRLLSHWVEQGALKITPPDQNM